jgi:hypothetical protein
MSLLSFDFQTSPTAQEKVLLKVNELLSELKKLPNKLRKKIGKKKKKN